MGFTLLVLVTGALLTRPTELVPELRTVNLNLILTLGCLAASFPAVLAQFVGPRREPSPITGCVLGVWLAVALSHLVRGDVDRAVSRGQAFAHVPLYYLLLVGLLYSPGRIRHFLAWLLVALTVMTAISLLQYYDCIDVTTDLDLKAVRERVQKDGEQVEYKRLRGPGRLLGDPNDVCSLFVLGTMLGLYFVTDRRSGAARLPALGSVALFLFAMYLTRSRGGLLGLFAGLTVLCHARLGGRRALAVMLPLLLAGMAALSLRGFSTAEGTGQQRIQLWAEGLRMFRAAPLFGVGEGRFTEELGGDDDSQLVAHNAYVHAFAELGFFGGALFLGAFYLAAVLLARARPALADHPDAEFAHLRPYLLALVVGYGVCIFSLSLAYFAPTYLVLALATAYLNVAARHAHLGQPAFDERLWPRLAAVGVAAVAFLYVFVRVFVRFG